MSFGGFSCLWIALILFLFISAAYLGVALDPGFVGWFAVDCFGFVYL